MASASSSAAAATPPPPVAGLDRRGLLAAAAVVALATTGCATPPPALAVQGLTAGRIPGVSGPDAEGLFTYTRPEGKSGAQAEEWCWAGAA